MTAKSGVKCRLEKFDLPGRPKADLVWLSDDKHGIRIAILPADGGEIASFQVRIGGRWQEILYRALDYKSVPPDGWEGRAPLLWPTSGRAYTPEQLAAWRRSGRRPRRTRYLLDGKVYDVPLHGFVRALPWQLQESGCDARSARAVCALESSPETRRMYPFDFRLAVTYTLAAGELRLRYEVVAGDNPRPMPFNIGNHISLRMPFTGRGRFEDCTIRTPARKLLELNTIGLLSGRKFPLDLSQSTPLSRTELTDGALGEYRQGELWLEVNDPAAMRLRIEQTEIPQGGRRLAAQEDVFFVLWGPPGRGYFCPEPWLGRPSSINGGRGGVLLPPGKRFVWEIRISIQLP